VAVGIFVNVDEILNKLEENRETIRGFGVRRLGIFGSYARGEQSEASDIDFLVEFERPTFKNYFGLKFFLEKLFDCKVDLVFNDTIKPRIRNTILEETVYAEGL
jgi:predicted nucleotidyltransferase